MSAVNLTEDDVLRVLRHWRNRGTACSDGVRRFLNSVGIGRRERLNCSVVFTTNRVERFGPGLLQAAVQQALTNMSLPEGITIEGLQINAAIYESDPLSTTR